MKEIKAREGYYLTQNLDVIDRVFVTKVKGINVNESDWREATIEEKQEYEYKLLIKERENGGKED